MRRPIRFIRAAFFLTLLLGALLSRRPAFPPAPSQATPSLSAFLPAMLAQAFEPGCQLSGAGWLARGPAPRHEHAAHHGPSSRRVRRPSGAAFFCPSRPTSGATLTGAQIMGRNGGARRLCLRWRPSHARSDAA